MIKEIKAGSKKKIQRKPYVMHLAEAYARGWKGCPCVFVLSTGRTGTMTMANLLALSSDIAAVHEPLPTLVKASYDAFMDNDKTDSIHYWVFLVLSARDDYVFDANLQGKVYVETNNRLTYFADALARAFPDSRFIYLHRNPFEVIYSALRRQWYCGHPWDFARIHPKQNQPLAALWDTLTPLEKNAWYWAEVNGYIMKFFDSLPQWRKFELPSDLLFSADREVLNGLFNFIGVEPLGMDKIQQVLSKKLNAQDAIPKQRKWSDSEKEIVIKIVHKVAIQLGYEL